MISWNEILFAAKHIMVFVIFICLIIAPVYLAAANGSAKYDNMRVRVGSWLFGWSIIGWIFALFVSAKK